MGADQIAVIRPAIRELEEAVSDTYFASFDVPGNENAWVQVALGTINFAYPFADDPMPRVSHLGLSALPDTTLNEWESGKYATVGYSHTVPARIVTLCVDKLFSELFGLGDDYRLDVSIEAFG